MNTDQQAYDDAWSEEAPAEKPAQAAVSAAQQAAAEDEKAFGEGWGLVPDDAPAKADAVNLEPAKEPEKPATFKEAFAQARKSGQKVFDWQGKKYSTDLAKPAKPVAKPVAEKAVEPAKTPSSLAEQSKGLQFTGMGSGNLGSARK